VHLNTVEPVRNRQRFCTEPMKRLDVSAPSLGQGILECFHSLSTGEKVQEGGGQEGGNDVVERRLQVRHVPH
jgi:hypothetical protein